MEFKGLAKLGNIVAETIFLMFPGVAKLGNICVREAKMLWTPGKNSFCFLSSKICFRNTCFPCGLTGKNLHPQQCFRNNVS